MELFLAFLAAQKMQENFENPFYFTVKVLPSAQKTQIKEQMADETWKILVAAPAEKGKANEELKKFFRKNFSLEISVISGETERKKLLKAVF